ncbi:hypothetical protein QCA50_001461 [Cerrena zonata]|uniref:RRM domain-containing protein n=1 Tax=Cerrena zonata TaxID=2478898 RepID=A0AAW0GTB1_9APHY
MSRLLVKNLPAYLTQSRLREHFESKDGPGGTLTDVKVVLKPDGTSRRFGFVGYKTDAEASKAQKWFDRTFVHSSKISVTIVDGTKDAPAPRPNKRPRLDGPSTSDKPSNVPSSSKGKEKATVVPSSSKSGQLKEYMKVMQPRPKGPSWANEDAVPGPSAPAPAPVSKLNLSQTLTTRHTKSTLTLQAEDKVFEQSDTESGDLPEPQDTDNHEPPPSDPNKASILETSRLFLRNLAFSCTEAELSELVAPFGTVSQVRIIPCSSVGRGCSVVVMTK